LARIETAVGLAAGPVPQDAGPRPGLFERLAEEPALLELAFLATLGIVAAWVILRLRARVRACAEEQSLGDVVFGLALAEDEQWEAAFPCLERACAADPGRASTRLARARAMTALGRRSEAHAEHLALRRMRGPAWERNERGLRDALAESAEGATRGPATKPGTPVCDVGVRPVSAAARSAPHGDAPMQVRLRRVEDPEGLLRAIRAEPDHVQALCSAPGAHHVEDVAALGPVAVAPSLLRAARAGADASHLRAIVAALPPELGPALVEVARGLEPFPAEPLRSLLLVIGKRGAPALAKELVRADRRVRHVLIDVFLGMADVAVFEQVLDAVPLIDVVQRCNEVPEDVLVPFLASLPESHFAFDALLPDGGFVRDRAVLRAIPDAFARRSLEALLARRGVARSLCTELVLALVDPRLATVAGRLLDQFGEPALGPLVLAFADAELSTDVRAAVRVRLVAAGPQAVDPLCACFGAHPTELDQDVVDVLAELGDPAVPLLRDACMERGLRARLSPGWRRRASHRRAMMVRVLGTIGSMQARAALTTIRAAESDPEVLLRIAQALHRLDADRNVVAIPRPDPDAQAGVIEPRDQQEADERG
jgi:hypothetical protein